MVDEDPPEARDLTVPGEVGVGSRIKDYRLEEVIGGGGMATVYRALDVRLGRQAAVKVLAPALAGDDSFRLRFQRESRAASAVDDPHIVRVYEWGQEGETLYIAMQLVSGLDLGTVIHRNGPLPLARVGEIVAQAASALDSAHAIGLVHRDVKPSNILLDVQLSGGDHVYLTDFGLSKVAVAHNSVNTDPGLFLGTVDYTAPEQIRGGAIDATADQYALACTAFEMLTGSPPFSRNDPIAVVYAHLNEPPPEPSSLRPGLPPSVDAALARAMAKSPAERFPSCGQFAAALKTGLAAAQLFAPAALPPLAPAPPPAAAAHVATGPMTVPPMPRTLDVPLKPSFRYVHEPVRTRQDALASLSNEHLLGELLARIRHSRGGTFLITGFRGVGKSTMVMRAVEEIVSQDAGSDLVLPVYLSVARPTTTERLLFAVVRRVFEEVSDSGLLGRLPAQTRHALLVAYMRTSLAFKETQSEARERAASLELGGMKTLVDLAIPKVSMSARRSRSLATEAAFLAYSETDVEHDLMRIVSLVDQGTNIAPTRRSWLPRPRRKPAAAPPRPHLIIVLDEVDKLTLSAAGMTAVEELLSGIKNVLTMPGAHFLIVAGPDLHDRAVRDAARGTGVYESVFGWRMYVPCTWDAPSGLLSDLVEPVPPDASGTLDVLAQYLRFKARGVPRRLLQEINSFVVWEAGAPRLRIGSDDLDRIRFYAHLEGILRDYFDSDDRNPLFPLPIDQDRRRLGGYYVLDWVLQSDGEPFSAADLLRDDEAQFDPLLRISRRDVDRLLGHLAGHGVLEVVREMNANATIFADIAESSATVYRLNAAIRRTIFSLAVQHEAERAALDISLTGFPQAGADRPDATGGLAGLPAAAGKVLGGRYELLDLLGQGGMGSVYKGSDLVTGRHVAVKLLRTSLGRDPLAVARLQREAELAKTLSHPQVIQTYDVLQDPDGGPAIVMELLHGRNLRQIVSDEGPLPPAEVAAVGSVLAQALDYIAAQRIVRLDLKPSNVIMADRGPVIIDLGIAIRSDASTAITRAGQLIGTPAYMAPELINGSDPDPRADQYALALVLYFCLVGKTPWDELAGAPAVIMAVMSEQVDTSVLPVSAEFRHALAVALSRNPGDRHASAAAFRSALEGTPEWRSLADQPNPSAPGDEDAAHGGDSDDVLV
jgi:serine/threonine protein kinase